MVYLDSPVEDSSILHEINMLSACGLPFYVGNHI